MRYDVCAGLGTARASVTWPENKHKATVNSPSPVFTLFFFFFLPILLILPPSSGHRVHLTSFILCPGSDSTVRGTSEKTRRQDSFCLASWVYVPGDSGPGVGANLTWGRIYEGARDLLPVTTK